jgi:alkylated DNA repair protein alkB family protein 8
LPSWLPPGAHLQHDFVSEAEDVALLAALPARADMTRLRQRSVAHYGRAYDYEAFALKAEPAAPWPPVVHELLASRLADAVAAVVCTSPGNSSTSSRTDIAQQPELTQLTVNAYGPGDGIAPHVDAPQAFGEHVAILSLGTGGVTMDFARLLDDDMAGAAVASAEDGTRSSSGSRLAAAATSHLHRQRARLAVEGGHVPPRQQRCAASVYLPPRSLLHLSGEVRYGWTHAIASRATDVVDGKVCPRGERVSLTFRSVGKG